MMSCRKSKSYMCQMSIPFLSTDKRHLRVGVAQWVSRLTHNEEVVGSSPIKGLRCFLEQEI